MPSTANTDSTEVIPVTNNDNGGSSGKTDLPDSATINNNETHEQRLKRFLLSTDPQTEYKKHNAQDAAKRFQYLLSLSPLFRYFIDTKATNDKALHKMIRQIDQKHATGKLGATSGGSNSSSSTNRRKRKSEKEEDAELIINEEDEMDESSSSFLSESPNYVDGKLRDYQIQGLNWLISLYENRLSGILADEMGLGKTLQTISFLGYLRYYKKIDGPFLVIVPKSTLDNWRREFAKWTKDVNVVVLQGDKEKRAEIINDVLMQAKFDICITSFEMVIREKSKLSKFRWQYMVIDEAHRIKNEQSSLSQIIRLFYSKNRLLITGTPLQNNLHELWALLNFLLPDVFGDNEIFNEWFEKTENKNDEDEKDQNSEEADGSTMNGESKDDKEAVEKLRKILSPFLLRRVKADVEKSLLPKKEINVYVGMTAMQIKWYRNLLQKDIEAVNGQVGKREGKTRLLNIVMQLRKCCNHPYLFEGAEPGPPYTNGEHLVFNAGKMVVLDKLLKKLKEEGSRVLIFSQMSRLLDILEDYCYLRDYQYCRIDGSTDHEDRINAIDDFNAPDSDKFIFLLTTRAGGLGINLTTADVVVLFDSDWNPQADLQAMDRAHRIGQKKQVKVFRFVTENAIEEKVLERAAQKLRLDQLVIQQGRSRYNDERKDNSSNKDDLLNMIQHGAQKVLDDDEGTISLDDDIEAILSRGEEKTKELNAKFEKLGLDDLQNFNGEQPSAYEWNGENFAEKKVKGVGIFLNPSKRVRKEHQYSVDGYYKDVMNQMKAPSTKPNVPRPPKHFQLMDFQFFDPRLNDYFEKEMLAYKKRVNYRVGEEDLDLDNKKYEGYDPEEFKKLSKKEQKNIIKEIIGNEQAKINESEPFTEEDMQEKRRLIEEGFGDWNKREFMQFIHGCAKYGPRNYKEISNDVKGKDEDDVRRYGEVFWKRYKEIEGWERYLKEIEIGERKLEKSKMQSEILRGKIKEVKYPIEELTIQYPPNNSKRMYSLIEDRYLLIKADEYGLMNQHLYDLIKQDIMKEELFRYCFYFKSRTTNEIARRIATLLLAVSREVEGPDAFKRKRKPGARLDSAADSAISSRQQSADVDVDESGGSAPSSMPPLEDSGHAEGQVKRRKIEELSSR